jgi:excisionase family DNA binding protein
LLPGRAVKRIIERPVLLTTKEAADYLGRNVYYLRRLVAKRDIAFHKSGHLLQFDVRDLDAHIAAGRVERGGHVGG